MSDRGKLHIKKDNISKTKIENLEPWNPQTPNTPEIQTQLHRKRREKVSDMGYQASHGYEACDGGLVRQAVTAGDGEEDQRKVKNYTY